ncbi:TIGR03943 family putative permease subunit [Desulfogranum marinum]|uniref:TIGR03943 family putative permease subunit n=1 Tax=Desulfogranum marinum TaxID=453220 RepID=UPI001962A86C|nr:TIGR03943 family protein [Desulfogranum marinum]MBM9514403.1 TIGR03943 family protein [Desulfogranum marinum]
MILRILNSILLSVWAIFLFWLLTFGRSDLVRLLHPRLWWVLGIAAVVLVLFLVSLVIPNRHAKSDKPIFMELPGILILLVPILYFSIAAEARLDGTSLQNRIIQSDNGMYLNSLPSFGIFDEPQSSGMVFSKILRKPKDFEGQQVEVVCRSLVNEKLPENIAMCYRYMITCCAADALPAFIFLSHTSEMKIENDRWVQINGPLSIIKNNGMEFPSVEIESLKYVEEPAFPWAM